MHTLRFMYFSNSITRIWLSFLCLHLVVVGASWVLLFICSSIPPFDILLYCSTESAAMPAATLEFSSLCLSNALHLLDDAETKSLQKLKEELGDSSSTNIQEKILVPAPPSLPMKLHEVVQLRYVSRKDSCHTG